jgi:release factor glutamine methyltransferase
MIRKSSIVNRKSMPSAYQTGTANFYGYDFVVNKHTLIPRPETEQLLERTVELAKTFLPENLRILDIGTGSGVIAVTLKKILPNAIVEATDISLKVLETAMTNANNNRVDIVFHAGNLFNPVQGKFDLVIANLPYVPAGRWRFLESQVRNFEPKAAIVAGRDGLKLIKQFCQEVGAHLNQPSIVALEIDDTHGPRVQQLLESALPDHQVRIETDLAHRDRFAIATPKGLESRI